MSLTRKILLAVLLAAAVGAVVFNLNPDQMSDFLKNPTANIQATIFGSRPEDDPVKAAATGTKGIVDVEDAYNNSIVRTTLPRD